MVVYLLIYVLKETLMADKKCKIWDAHITHNMYQLTFGCIEKFGNDAL